MSTLPITIDTLEKCQIVLKEELSQDSKDVLNKIINKRILGNQSPRGEVYLVTGKTLAVTQTVASYLFLIAKNERRAGQKVLFIPATSILKDKKNELKIEDSKFLVIDGIELCGKFEIKLVCTALEKFKKQGGVCFIPTYLDYEQTAQEFGLTIANYFFKSLIAEFNLGG